MRSGMIILVVVVGALNLAGCEGKPIERSQQWVARDAWDPTCAEKAMVEQWAASNPRWEIQGEVYAVDVEAKFRMTDDCQSGLPIVGKAYKTIEVVPFKGTVTMSKCKKDGDTGWSLKGKESTRCWTGPSLAPGKK